MHYFELKGIVLEALPARPVGEWEGRKDILLTSQDIQHLHKLGLTLHTSKHYGLDLGCLAVKKIIVVNAFGDVMPCIWMYYSLGNILKESFTSLIEKGMKIFRGNCPTCRMQDPDFLDRYNSDTKGATLPVPIEYSGGENEESYILSHSKERVQKPSELHGVNPGPC